MKKSSKGALAAGAAAILLLGGAGTLAYWSDSADVNGGSVRTGTLALSDPDCDAQWVYAAGNAGAGNPVTLIVPGDTLQKQCRFDVDATGDNLTATLTTPGTVAVSTDKTAPTFDATVGAAYAIAGNPVPSVITSDNDGDTVIATITVTFPFGDASNVNANDTQDVTAMLDAIPVTLTQTES